VRISRLAHLAAALALAAVLGCKDKPPPPPVVDSGVSASAGDAAAPASLSREEASKLLENGCLSCHSKEMVAQQRLTPAQWSKVVTKMIGWGANLEEAEAPRLAAWLATTYGVDAGPYETVVIEADAAAAEIAALPDGAFAGGDAERGRPLYLDRCSGCHGAEGRGHIGVLLVDRPFLYRAQEFASTIRHGRGKMTPIAMPDAEIGDVLAHLRRLKNP
jgi:cytochrome c2